MDNQGDGAGALEKLFPRITLGQGLGIRQASRHCRKWTGQGGVKGRPEAGGKDRLALTKPRMFSAQDESTEPVGQPNMEPNPHLPDSGMAAPPCRARPPGRCIQKGESV